MFYGIIAPFVFEQSWLIPKSSHVWFILPFLVIMMIAPVLNRILLSVRRIVIACVILVSMLGTMDSVTFFTHVKIPNMAYYLVVYGFFFIIGFLYKRIEVKGSFFLLSGVLIISMVIVILISGVYPSSMQGNKFPPNLVFLLYNLGILFLLCFVIQKVRIPDWNWIDEYNTRGYTIYLYQNWVFFVFSMIFLKPLRLILPDVILFLPSLLIVFFIHKLSSKYIYILEQSVLHRVFKK